VYVVRFVVYNMAGDHQLTSLVEQFTRELMQSPPDLLVIGGLRLLLAARALPGFMSCHHLSFALFQEGMLKSKSLQF